MNIETCKKLLARCREQGNPYMIGGGVLFSENLWMEIQNIQILTPLDPKICKHTGKTCWYLEGRIYLKGRHIRNRDRLWIPVKFEGEGINA